MSEILERRLMKDGDVIFREDEPGSNAYILQEGKVVITKVVNGIDTELATVGKGGVFGEMALIDEKPRSATARVKGSAVVVTVSKSMYENKLKGTDPFIRALLRILVETVRSTSQ